MDFDAVYSGPPQGIVAAAQAASRFGCRALWTPEAAHDPFLALLLAHQSQPALEVGTAIVVALARSPMTLAQTAWDLAGLTQGKLLLGLGSQIKPHITKRFSMPWQQPVEQMREMMAALRAVWAAFAQPGSPLRFEGKHYRLTLLTPFFTPPPHPFGQIPVGLAAVGPKMTELAGEAADFAVLHPFTTVPYLRQVTLPALERGLKLAGRERSALSVVGSTFVVSGEGQQAARMEERVRRTVSFYASTPAYAPVLEVSGLESVGRELYRLSKAGRWEDMPAQVTDELLSQVCVYAPTGSLRSVMTERFQGLYDRAQLHMAPEELDQS